MFGQTFAFSMVMFAAAALLLSFLTICIRHSNALPQNIPPPKKGPGNSIWGRPSDGFRRGNGEKTVVLLYNKPPNVVTSHVSDDARTTVYDEIQNLAGHSISFEEITGIRSKLHAIGRLDADTTGLLLLTNDGGLVHHVTNRNASSHDQSPLGPITKTYEALIMGHHDEESLAEFRNGIDIGAKYGGMTRPVDDLQILDHPNHKTTLVSLTISEGKNRQVRRMFHALGSGVMKLKRTKIGKYLTLDGVEQGKWRILSEQEVRDYLGWEPKDLDAAAANPTKMKTFPRQKEATKNTRRTRRGPRRK